MLVYYQRCKSNCQCCGFYFILMRPSGISSRQYVAMQTASGLVTLRNVFSSTASLQIVGKWTLYCRFPYLFVWVDVDVAFDTFLPHVGPGVATHPLPLTLGALVLSKASLLPLVGCQPFTFGSGLWKAQHCELDTCDTRYFKHSRPDKTSGVQMVVFLCVFLFFP